MRGATMDRRRRRRPLGGRTRPAHFVPLSGHHHHGGAGRMVVVWMTTALLLLLLLLLDDGTLVSAGTNRPLGSSDPSKGFPYIYGAPGDPNASFPVTEHLARLDRPDYDQRDDGADDDEDDDEEEEDDRPDFLYDDAIDTYRLVEFYGTYVGRSID